MSEKLNKKNTSILLILTNIYLEKATLEKKLKAALTLMHVRNAMHCEPSIKCLKKYTDRGALIEKRIDNFINIIYTPKSMAQASLMDGIEAIVINSKDEKTFNTIKTLRRNYDLMK